MPLFTVLRSLRKLCLASLVIQSFYLARANVILIILSSLKYARGKYCWLSMWMIFTITGDDQQGIDELKNFLVPTTSITYQGLTTPPPPLTELI